MEAYIREIRLSMEGSKGGHDGSGKYFTDYRPISKRWEDYRRFRNQHGLPVVGSIHLFTKVWKNHKASYPPLPCIEPMLRRHRLRR